VPAGHDVLFATGERFRPLLQELGFWSERVGISIEEADGLALQQDPRLNELPREERWRFGVVVFGDVLPRRTFEDLSPLLEGAAPDLLIYDEVDIGAAAAAHSAGVPAVSHSLGRQLPDPIRRAALERLALTMRSHGAGGGAPPRRRDRSHADARGDGSEAGAPGCQLSRPQRRSASCSSHQRRGRVETMLPSGIAG
jgi:hypothetical protein